MRRTINVTVKVTIDHADSDWPPDLLIQRAAEDIIDRNLSAVDGRTSNSVTERDGVQFCAVKATCPNA